MKIRLITDEGLLKQAQNGEPWIQSPHRWQRGDILIVRGNTPHYYEYDCAGGSGNAAIQLLTFHGCSTA